MIQLTSIDKDEWMPRVTVEVIETAEQARQLADEMLAAGLQSDIQTFDLIAQSSSDGWPEGYAVRLRQDNASPLVGWAHALLHKFDKHTAELCWETARKYQGHGYMREAIPRVVKWLLDRRGIDTVEAWVSLGHEASQKVANADGLRPTTVLIPLAEW